MKKKLSALLIILGLLVNSVSAVYGTAGIDIIKEKVNNGILMISVEEKSVKTKIIIEKDKEKYYYDLKDKKDAFPLQLGSGKYKVSVLENIRGNKYKVLMSESFVADLTEENAVYLGSAQPVKWDKDMESIKKAKSLMSGKNEKNSVKAVYEYIVNNIKYDYNKINSVEKDYMPDIDQVNKEKKGICYDYAALFAAMLRSGGIPAKLVKGYKNDIKEYHAWNEVYLEGRWIVVDTTYDSWVKNNGKSYSMEKDRSLYKALRVY